MVLFFLTGLYPTGAPRVSAVLATGTHPEGAALLRYADLGTDRGPVRSTR
jgi:hypothetical protein